MAVGGLLLSPPVRAAPPNAGPAEPEVATSTEVPAPSRRVTVLVGSTWEHDIPGLRAAIDEHARSHGVVVEFVPLDDGVGPLAQAEALAESGVGVFWLTPRPDGLALYLYASRRHAVFIRMIPRGADDSDAAIVDAVGVIMASTADALDRDDAIGMRPAEEAELRALELVPAPSCPEPPACPVAEPAPTDASAPPPELDPPPPPASAWPVAIGLRYLGLGLDRRSPWQSGVWGQVQVRVHRWVRLGLSYGSLGPTARAPLGLSVARHELGLETAVGTQFGQRVAVHATVLTGVQLLRWSTVQRDGVRPIATLSPGVELSLGLVGDHQAPARLRLDVGLGATTAFNNFGLVVCEADTTDCPSEATREVLRPWRVAPRATVGLSVVFDARRPAPRQGPHTSAT